MKNNKQTDIECTLEPINDVLNWKYIAEQCYGKTPSWLYNKIHENNRQKMNDDDKAKLTAYLIGLSNRIARVALKL